MVDADLDVYGVVVAVLFGDGESVRRCEFNGVAVGRNGDAIPLVVLVNAPSGREIGLFVGEKNGETLEKFVFGVPENCDGVIRRQVGDVGDIDRVGCGCAVITDAGAAFPADRIVGGRQDKGDVEGSGRHHREGKRHIVHAAGCAGGGFRHRRTLASEADGRHNGLVVFGDGNDVLGDCAEFPFRRHTLLRKPDGDGLVLFRRVIG